MSILKVVIELLAAYGVVLVFVFLGLGTILAVLLLVASQFGWVWGFLTVVALIPLVQAIWR